MASSSLVALAAAVLCVPGRPERVLEIGCGDGERVLFLAREFPAARVRGVDGSAEAIREAVSRIGLDPEGRVAFKQGRSRALPYPDDFFDLVTQSSGGLHAGELARVLHPGGHLILIGSRRWLDWRLEKHCFVLVERGDSQGLQFQVMRLDADDPARE